MLTGLVLAARARAIRRRSALHGALVARNVLRSAKLARAIVHRRAARAALVILTTDELARSNCRAASRPLDGNALDKAQS